ncbi:retrovirus-related pol polyprotein from transposon TNT 1-94 [Tanacetum coccineum]
MKAIRRKNKCLAAIGERPAEVMDDSKWDEMDGNAVANLHLALADGVLSSIEEKKSAKEIWDHLARFYEARSLHNKKFLKRKLYSLRMTESTSVIEHINNLNTLFSQLTSLSCIIEPQERVEILLQSLPDSYDQVIINLTSNILLDYLVFDDVVAAILEEKIGAITGRTGKLVQDRWRPWEISLALQKMVTLRFVKQWLQMKAGRDLQICNDHELKITRIGSIMVKMHDGTVRTIRDVRHVEGLKENLLSLGQLDNLGCKVEIQNKIMKIIKGALVLMRGEKVATNLYQRKGEIIEEVESSVASHSPSHTVTVTWHQKLRHMSEQGMKILVERKLLPGLTKVSLPFCKHCVMSKQHCLKFKTSISRSVYVLELVHSDVWQASILSLREAKYFVSFIDDYSRRCWVYPIKKKSDVFKVFKVYKARVKLDSGKKIKCLRTDNGCEYTSEEFDTFCRQERIKRKFTTAYTPQQNGVAERIRKSKIELKTPIEMWMRKPINCSDLYIFRSLVYVTYNTQETTKLDSKSKKCLFLGYADEVNGYHLWDPTAHKIEKEFQSNDSFEAAPQHEVNETNESQAPATRTFNCERRRLGWHSDYVMESSVAYCILTEEGEPSTLQEALNNPDASLWKEAMQEEIEALHKNKTWELVPLPGGRKPIGNKLVYKTKKNGNDQAERYRARLVVKGYAQKEGIDFNKFFPIPNKDHINKLKAQLAREFEMKDLGPANKIPGMQIQRDRVSRKIWLSQKSYVKKILQRFNMQDCKPISTPFLTNVNLSSKMSSSSEKERMKISQVPYASAVESLMFAMICTRPDIAHAVGVVSRYMAEPGRGHWEAVKRIFRYIKRTSDVALCFGDSDLIVKGYVDSDYAGDLDGSKSTTGYVFTLSGGTVS